MKLSLTALFAAALLALAACGDDDDDSTSTTSSSTTTTEESGTTGASGTDGAQAEPCPEASFATNITKVVSYGVDCAAVEDAIDQVGAVSASFKLGDFQCEMESGNELAGTWRCDGEAGYFTFTFAD